MPPGVFALAARSMVSASPLYRVQPEALGEAGPLVLDVVCDDSLRDPCLARAPGLRAAVARVGLVDHDLAPRSARRTAHTFRSSLRHSLMIWAVRRIGMCSGIARRPIVCGLILEDRPEKLADGHDSAAADRPSRATACVEKRRDLFRG